MVTRLSKGQRSTSTKKVTVTLYTIEEEETWSDVGASTPALYLNRMFTPNIGALTRLNQIPSQNVDGFGTRLGRTLKI